MRIATLPPPILKLPPAKELKPPSCLRHCLPAPKGTALLQLLIFVTNLIVLEQYATEFLQLSTFSHGFLASLNLLGGLSMHKLESSFPRQ